MARLFDDVAEQYLQVGSAVATGPPLTMGGWFYSDDATKTQTVIAIDTLDTGNQHFRVLAAGATAGDPLKVQTRDSAGASAATTSTGFSANQWHHAAGVYAATNDRRAFLDGGGKGTNTATRTPAGLGGTSIGETRVLNPSNPFSGRIAEVAVWDVALSDAEVALWAKGISPLVIRPDHLLAYWPLVGRTDPEPDVLGGFNLSLNPSANKPAWAEHPGVLPRPRTASGQFGAPPAPSFDPALTPVLADGVGSWHLEPRVSRVIAY